MFNDIIFQGVFVCKRIYNAIQTGAKKNDDYII